MALIRCPECNHEVSDSAEICPNCGYRIKKYSSTIVNNQQSTPHYYQDVGSYGGGWALGFFLGLIGLIIGIAIDKSETKRGAIHGFLVELVLGSIIGIVFAIIYSQSYRYF